MSENAVVHRDTEQTHKACHKWKCPAQPWPFGAFQCIEKATLFHHHALLHKQLLVAELYNVGASRSGGQANLHTLLLRTNPNAPAVHYPTRQIVHQQCKCGFLGPLAYQGKLAVVGVGEKAQMITGRFVLQQVGHFGAGRSEYLRGRPCRAYRIARKAQRLNLPLVAGAGCETGKPIEVLGLAFGGKGPDKGAQLTHAQLVLLHIGYRVPGDLGFDAAQIGQPKVIGRIAAFVQCGEDVDDRVVAPLVGALRLAGPAVVVLTGEAGNQDGIQLIAGGTAWWRW